MLVCPSVCLSVCLRMISQVLLSPGVLVPALGLVLDLALLVHLPKTQARPMIPISSRVLFYRWNLDENHI